MHDSTPLISSPSAAKPHYATWKLSALILTLLVVFVAGMVFIFFLTPPPGPPCDSIVNTTEGTVQGSCSQNGKFREFLGIPFAQPPTGHLRFRHALPPPPHQSPLLVVARKPFCIQTDLLPLFKADNSATSEDCLYLNIVAPTVLSGGNSSQTVFPVVIYIHGGGFLGGGSYTWNGSDVAESNNVVVVTLAYRLGALGALAHPALSDENPDGISGNYGVSDALMALDWVKRNIRNFRGNPDNITICGVSAGASLTEALILSSRGDGKYNTAISWSAGSLMMSTLSLREKLGANITRDILNCTSGNFTELRTCLRSLPKDAFNVPGGPPGTFIWGPNVDGVIIEDQPEEIYRTKNFSNVNFVWSTTEGEWGWFDALQFPNLVNSTKADVEAYISKEYNNFTNLIWANYNFVNFSTPYSLQARIRNDRYHCRVKFLLKILSNKSPATCEPDSACSSPTSSPSSSSSSAFSDNVSLYLFRFDHVLSTLPSFIERAPHGTDQPFFFNSRFCWPSVCNNNQQFTSDEHSLMLKFREFSLNLTLWEKFSINNQKGLRLGPGNQAKFEDFALVDNCELWDIVDGRHL